MQQSLMEVSMSPSLVAERMLILCGIGNTGLILGLSWRRLLISSNLRLMVWHHCYEVTRSIEQQGSSFCPRKTLSGIKRCEKDQHVRLAIGQELWPSNTSLFWHFSFDYMVVVFLDKLWCIILWPPALMSDHWDISFCGRSKIFEISQILIREEDVWQCLLWCVWVDFQFCHWALCLQKVCKQVTTESYLSLPNLIRPILSWSLCEALIFPVYLCCLSEFLRPFFEVLNNEDYHAISY